MNTKGKHLVVRVILHFFPINKTASMVVKQTVYSQYLISQSFCNQEKTLGYQRIHDIEDTL